MATKSRALIVALLALLVGLGSGYYIWSRSPQYALRRAATAAADHDLTTFQRFVDTEKLSARFVDDMLASVTEEAQKNEFGGLAAGMVMMMRPQLVKAAQDSLERGIETGKFEPEKKDGGNPAEAVKPYWKPAAANESGYRRVAYVKKQGKIALAGLEIYDADVAKPFIIDLKLCDVGDHWQIVEVANLHEIQKEMRLATERRLAQINAPIRQQINNILEVEHIAGFLSHGSWGFDQKSNVSVRFRNRSQKEIVEVHFTVKFESEGETLGAMKCEVTESIGPGERSTGTWSQDANQFISDDMKLYNGIATAKPSLEIESIRFSDSSSLQLRSSLTEPEPTARRPPAN